MSDLKNFKQHEIELLVNYVLCVCVCVRLLFCLFVRFIRASLNFLHWLNYGGSDGGGGGGFGGSREVGRNNQFKIQ